MISKTLMVAFMASFMSGSSAGPCKVSSRSTEISTGSDTTASSTEAPTSTESPTTTLETSMTTETALSSTLLSSTEDSTITVTQSESSTEATTTTIAAPSITQPTTDIDCSTNADCVAALGANALGLYACVDLICQKVNTAP